MPLTQYEDVSQSCLCACNKTSIIYKYTGNRKCNGSRTATLKKFPCICTETGRSRGEGVAGLPGISENVLCDFQLVLRLAERSENLRAVKRFKSSPTAIT